MGLTFRAPGVAAADWAVATSLCIRSKAMWGYDDAFMAACVAELTLTAASTVGTRVVLVELDGKLCAVAQVGPSTVGRAGAELSKLFVAPEVTRWGLGRHLMVWARAAARSRCADTLWIVADPNAVAFYQRQGGRVVDHLASGSIPGRTLPLMCIPA